MSAPPFFARHQSLRALAHRDFQLLLLGSGIVSFVLPIQFLTQVFWVQENYPKHDVLFVGLISATRGVAMLSFSLIGGAIADRFERRRVLLFCESTALGLNAVVAVLMLANPFGSATILALLVMTFLAAGNMAIDQPARAASIPAIVGMADLSNGIGLQMIAVQLSTPLSLPLVGLLNAKFSPGEVYAGSLLAWLAILPLIGALRYRSHGGASKREGMLGNIRAGLAYSRRDPTILGVISIVLILQMVGMPGPATLGPLWMTEVIGLSKSQFGLIAMTWGMGAMAASVFFARMHMLTRRGATLCACVLLFAVSAIIFGHSRIVWLTALVNFTLGFGVVGTMVCGSTIVQHVVSEEMRGRVMGLFPLAMGLALANAGPVSLAGQLVGLEVMLPVLAWSMLFLTLVVVAWQPALRAANPRPAPPDVPALAAE